MAFTILGACAALSIAILIWAWFGMRQPKFHQGKNLPGPVAIPILGSLPHLVWKLGKNPLQLSSFQLLLELRKHFVGEVLGLTLGQNKFIILDELPLIKKVLCSEDWADRIKDNAMFKERTFGIDYGLLTSNGDSWREMRRFLAKTMVKFGFGRGSALQTRQEEEISEFFKYFDQKYPGMGNSDGAVVEMQGLFNVAPLNILWTMVTSSRFPYNSEKVVELTSLLERMTKDIHPKEMGFLAFPWLRYIPGATGYTRFMRDAKMLNQYFGELIKERRELNLYKREQNNFVDAFLAEIDHITSSSTSPDSNYHYADEQLICVLVDLFVTGFLPIASCLEYLVMFMILHPHVQDKCRKELDIVLDGSKPTVINNPECMPYISATIAETLRKVTLIPLTSRAATKDTWVDKYFVEKGTVALINLYHVHHNDNVWNEPDLFKPERFLDANGKLINQELILPFGTGKRTCPAEVFGRLTIFAFFVSFLQRYEFRSDPENFGDIDSTPNAGMGNYPKPFKIFIKIK